MPYAQKGMRTLGFDGASLRAEIGQPKVDRAAMPKAPMSRLATVQGNTQDFASSRAQSRREDQIAMSTGKASPAELQRQNSILPDDFWSKAKVNWEALAVDKRPNS